MNVELALKVNKFIHEQCIDGVPHDIGWNVIKLIEAETEANKISVNPDVIKSLIDFGNFIGDRPLPEYSKSTNKWRWWNNDTRTYSYASTEDLLGDWKKSINV